jgi:hypothetical protein
MLCMGMPQRRLRLRMIILRRSLKLCIPWQSQGTRKVGKVLTLRWIRVHYYLTAAQLLVGAGCDRCGPVLVGS